MKALPCQTAGCTGDKRQVGPKLFGRALVALPTGGPYVLGRASGFPLIVKCATCKRPSTFTATQFNGLPELTVDQLRALDQLEPLARDWVGAGLPVEHAEQVVGAGLMGPSSVAPREGPEL